MENLKNIFNVYNSDLDAFMKAMQNKDVKNQAKQFLQSLNVNNVKETTFLSSFLICKFPSDFLDNPSVDKDKLLLNLANKIYENNQNTIKDDIISYNEYYSIWASNDIEKLKNVLYRNYVELLDSFKNASTEDEKTLFQNSIDFIVTNASLIKFNIVEYHLQQTQSSPEMLDINVLYDIDAFNTQFKNAFSNILKEEIQLKQYIKFKDILIFIKNFLLIFYISKESEINSVLDIDFILQQLSHDAFNNSEIISLFTYTYDLLKGLQAPIHDNELQDFKTSLNNSIEQQPVDIIPTHIINIISCIKFIIYDLNELKNKMNNENQNIKKNETNINK